MTGINHARKPCLAESTPYRRLCCNGNRSRLSLRCKVSPRLVARFIPDNVRGFSLSSNSRRQGSSPRNAAPHRETPAYRRFYDNPPGPTSNMLSLCATPRNQPTGRDLHSSVELRPSRSSSRDGTFWQGTPCSTTHHHFPITAYPANRRRRVYRLPATILAGCCCASAWRLAQERY